MEKQWKQWETCFLGLKNHEDSDCSHEIKRCLLLGRKAMTNLDSILKKQRYYFAYKGLYNQSSGFPAVMYGCESWTIKKAEHWRIDAFELHCWKRLLRVPWSARRPQRNKGNQPWIFIGRTDAKAEALILWLPDVKSWLTGKDPDAGKDWRQEENRKTEDEMVGWHHQLNGPEFG